MGQEKPTEGPKKSPESENGKSPVDQRKEGNTFLNGAFNLLKTGFVTQGFGTPWGDAAAEIQEDFKTKSQKRFDELIGQERKLNGGKDSSHLNVIVRPEENETLDKALQNLRMYADDPEMAKMRILTYAKLHGNSSIRDIADQCIQQINKAGGDSAKIFEALTTYETARVMSKARMPSEADNLNAKTDRITMDWKSSPEQKYFSQDTYVPRQNLEVRDNKGRVIDTINPKNRAVIVGESGQFVSRGVEHVRIAWKDDQGHNHDGYVPRLKIKKEKQS